MSRAFVREDDREPPPREWRLPPRDEPGYDAAAAEALLEAARIGETSSAELATGFAWGSPQLVPHVEQLLVEAVARGDDRLEQVAERFLAAATKRRR